MIEQLNGKITVLTGEVKLLQSDKETGKTNCFSSFWFSFYVRGSQFLGIGGSYLSD